VVDEIRSAEAGAMGAPGAEPRCPECGFEVSQSLPERRTGSRWQREMGWSRWGLLAWAATSASSLFTPTKVFDRVIVSRRGAWPLLIINTVAAAAITLSPLAGMSPNDPLRSLRTLPGFASVTQFTGWFALYTAACALLLGAMMAFEYFSVRFIAARRGWRLLPDAALQAVAHASVGWIVASVLGHLAWQLVFVALRFTDASSWIASSDLLRKIQFGQSEVSLVFVALAYFAGMFWFELIVFRGIRRMRFANAPRGAIANV
jgi:hypothetical protein